jgi:hypothetical protein
MPDVQRLIVFGVNDWPQECIAPIKQLSFRWVFHCIKFEPRIWRNQGTSWTTSSKLQTWSDTLTSIICVQYCILVSLIDNFTRLSSWSVLVFVLVMDGRFTAVERRDSKQTPLTLRLCSELRFGVRGVSSNSAPPKGRGGGIRQRNRDKMSLLRGSDGPHMHFYQTNPFYFCDFFDVSLLFAGIYAVYSGRFQWGLYT